MGEPLRRPCVRQIASGTPLYAPDRARRPRAGYDAGRLLRRFARVQLRIDQAADLQQLRAVERARQRVAAVVVDPVIDTHAVLDRVAERGFVAAWRGLARLQREPLLGGVLVHEKRGGLLVAR